MASNGRAPVIAVFAHEAHAERGLEDLRRAGFPEESVGYARLRVERLDGLAVGDDHRADAGRPASASADAGGSLATSLGGDALSAAAGGLPGALTRAGVPEAQARYYDAHFQAGRTVVTVHADGRDDEAADVLRRAGAYDVELGDGADHHGRA